MLASLTLRKLIQGIPAIYIKISILSLCSLMACLIYFLRLPITNPCPVYDIDCSWILDMQAKTERGLWSGRDFYFTFGPLWQIISYLPNLVRDFHNILSQAPFRFLGQFIASLLVLNVILLALPRLNWQTSLIIMATFTLCEGLLNLKSLYCILLVVGLSYLYTAIDSKQAIFLACILGIATFLGQLISFELGIYGSVLLVAFGLLSITLIRFRKFFGFNPIIYRDVFKRCSLTVGTFLSCNLLISIIYLFSSETYTDLFAYQYYSFRLAKNYNYTMGHPWMPDLVFTFLIYALICYAFGTCIRRIHRFDEFEAYLYGGLLILACISLKTGVIQSDNLHVIAAITPFVFIFLCLGFAFRKDLPITLYATILLAMLGLFWPYSVRSSIQTLADAVLWRQSVVARLRQAVGVQVSSTDMLPAALQADLDGDSRLLNFPFENVLAVALERENVVPFLQPYVANSSELQQEYVNKAAYYKEQTEVIYCVNNGLLDGVSDITRSPIIIDYLLTWFRPKNNELYNGCVILEPRAEPREIDSEPIAFTQRVQDDTFYFNLDHPGACRMLNLNIEIMYPAWSILGRPTPLLVEVHHGVVPIVTRKLVPLSTNGPFWTYLYVGDEQYSYHLFDEAYDWPSDPTVTGFLIKPAKLGLFDIPPEDIKVHEIRCVGFQEHFDLALQATSDLASDPIIAGMLLEQEFMAPFDRLEGVAVKIGTFERINQSSLLLEVREVGSDTLLASHVFDAASLEDNSYVRLPIPIQAESRGKRYVLSISSPDATLESGVAVWMQTGNPYQHGVLYANGEPKEYDLQFSLLFAR